MRKKTSRPIFCLHSFIDLITTVAGDVTSLNNKGEQDTCQRNLNEIQNHHCALYDSQACPTISRSYRLGLGFNSVCLPYSSSARFGTRTYRASVNRASSESSRVWDHLIVCLTIVLCYMLFTEATLSQYPLSDFGLAESDRRNANTSAHDMKGLSDSNNGDRYKPPDTMRTIRTPNRLSGYESHNGVLVHTKHGIFKGILKSNQPSSRNPVVFVDKDTAEVVGFLGIRYASAPVKRLRFMPPTAYHYAPNRLHDAQNYGPICMQRWPVDFNNHQSVAIQNLDDAQKPNTNERSNIKNKSSSEMDIKMQLLARMLPGSSFSQLSPLFRRLMNSEQSEDCLNLNIFVPFEALQDYGRSNVTLPVLVIIHGESFDYGSGSAYDGHRLIYDKKILVVTFNYRLNILGFPPKLLGASRGNLGLMDQIAALNWIKDNIGSFGGSANNITLMGTKRGAMFVNLLMISPMAKGLFQRAIMEDGSALTPIMIHQAISLNPQSYYQHSHSVQYVKMLAKLNNCLPMRSTNATIQTGSGSFDDGKLNAQIIDCLRYKPIEQILQRIPLDILQFDSKTGDLFIHQRWSGTIQSILGIELGPKTPIEAYHMTKLYDLVKSSNLNETSDLFELLYAPGTSSNVRPFFSPLVDGSIVPEEDLASYIMKEECTFAQRDLLIGFTHLVSSSSSSSSINRGATNEGEHQQERDPLNKSHQFTIDNYLSERISSNIEQQGLTNEQAINLVNAFVRSFYRFHNQEIANSILNHYLSLTSNHWQMKNVYLPTNKSRSRSHDETEENHIRPDFSNHSSAIANKLQIQRQRLLLSSLGELFQDSLTDVPLFKVALLHSIKQLEPLIDVFVGQRFREWKHQSDGGENYLADKAKVSEESKHLLDTFTIFAKTLHDDINWPLDLHSSSSFIQPKSTYLYDFDQFNVNKVINESIERVISREVTSDKDNIWKLIRRNLKELDSRVRGLRIQLGIGCAFYSQFELNSYNDNESDTLNHLEDWLCRKIIRVLNNFVQKGNVNTLAKEPHPSKEEQLNLGESLIDLETKCFARRSDHHSVLPDEPNQVNIGYGIELNGDCLEEVSRIAFILLTNELEFPRDRITEHKNWNAFDLFSPQIATLIDPISLWIMRSIVPDDNTLDGSQSLRTSLTSKSSFWLNFVPALNCNKTQPIIPTALLDGPLAISSNSSLLNMNLIFSCQHGAKKLKDLFESIGTTIEQRFQSRKTQWKSRKLSQQATGQQNHHSLRMANISQSSSMEEGPDVLDDQIPSMLNASSLNPLIINEQGLNNNHDRGGLDPTNDLKSRTTGFVLVICASIVCLTLISGAYVALKQRRKERRRNSVCQEDEKQEMNSSEVFEYAIDDRETSENRISGELSNDQHNNSGPMMEVSLDQDSQSDAKHILATATANNEQINLDGGLYNSTGHDQYHIADVSGCYLTTAENKTTNSCKSHTTMGLVSQQESEDLRAISMIGGPSKIEPTLIYEREPQEPIILPILTSHQLRSNTLGRSERGFSQETGSSLDPQLNGLMMTTKTRRKRVKIKDPTGNVENLSNGKNLRTDFVDANVQLCPIHSRSHSSQQLAAIDAGYFVNSDEYLTLNNPELWNMNYNQLNLTGQHSCEHFSQSTTTTSQDMDQVSNQSRYYYQRSLQHNHNHSHNHNHRHNHQQQQYVQPGGVGLPIDDYHNKTRDDRDQRSFN